ncbi:MAG: short-chain dehydrogenase [Bdellovibrionaceae bacterium]|nr:short-chain dehydrogenase [Pseudobdellovibrionaceae bacterium]|tara:strand:- start:158458 stop:159195 length:738 start_codon:yes stop_codon:yes gene_type:complete
MELGLSGKRALVFGASDGIGKAIAESLIGEGAEVILNSRSADKLEKTVSAIGAKGFVAGDLSLSGEGDRVVQQAIKEFGPVDILVTNTGGPAKNNFMDVSTEQWQTDFNSLWMSTVDAVKACLPGMQERRYGRVLMITSIAAKEPLVGLTTSNGLRAGLNGLSKTISQEMASFGITSNVVLPGYTNTDRLKALNLSEEQIKKMVPTGRLGEPKELADLVTFLASERAAYINGQVIAVDGGVLGSY